MAGVCKPSNGISSNWSSLPFFARDVSVTCSVSSPPFLSFTFLSFPFLVLVAEVLLQQLKDGTAKFELLHFPNSPTSDGLQSFARISSSLGRMSPAMKKMEHYSVQKVTGDGRCMFRALVKGMARNKGITLSPTDERDDAVCMIVQMIYGWLSKKSYVTMMQNDSSMKKH